jgi:hypothetical protein
VKRAGRDRCDPREKAAARRRIGAALALTLQIASSGACTAPQAPLVVQRGAVQELDARTGPRVNRAVLQADGAARWDDRPLAQVELCPPPQRTLHRKVLLLAPRVDRVLCSGRAGDRPRYHLFGFGDDGAMTWRRELGFVSADRRIDEDVIGAAPTGLTLSDLAVLATESGEPLSPAPSHVVGRGPERRPVPDHRFTGPGLHVPERGGFVWFAADVTLIKRSGGLFFLDTRQAQARPQLVVPLSTTLLAAYWRPSELAAAPGGRFLLQAECLATRGRGPARVSVIDMKEWSVAFEERFAPRSLCADAQVIAGPAGFAFSFLDQASAKRVLVPYRVDWTGSAPH